MARCVFLSMVRLVCASQKMKLEVCKSNAHNELFAKWHCCILGPCFNSSTEMKCDFMGRFYPLQCFKNQSQCWCVDPINGTEINNTRKDMDENSKPPECSDKGDSSNSSRCAVAYMSTLFVL